MDHQRKWAGWIILGIAFVLAAAIFTLNQGTAVAQPGTQQQQTDESIMRQLFPYAAEGSEAFEKLDADGLEAHAVMRGGETLGYTAKQTVQGYAGPVEVTVGLRPDNTIAGIHVGGKDFKETEGLGAKAREPEFTDQFTGKAAPVSFDEIDGIAGATVTSRAVTDGVNTAAALLKPYLSSSGTRTANASAIGYNGPVLVRLTLDQEGVITDVNIGGARFMETDGVGGKVREKEFTDQFIGKTPPVSLGEEIDAVSGATVSTEAAVKAVNDAAAFLAR